MNIARALNGTSLWLRHRSQGSLREIFLSLKKELV